MYKFLPLIFFISSHFTFASELKVGAAAPLFSTQTHEGKSFDLKDRKGHWTVLYFYPKAETPGCTKQACAFRDSISEIRKLNADVFGVSSDSVQDIKKFHQNQKLNFTLLSDHELKIIDLYGVKAPILNMAKRWTFIIDPSLKIRFIDDKVNPVTDASNMIAKIKEFQVSKN